MYMSKLARLAVVASVGAMTTTSLSASAPAVTRKGLFDPLSMIRRASPGIRTAGALPNKVRPKKVVVRRAPVHQAKVAARRPKPISAVLPTAVEAPMPIEASSVPLATAATPLPLAAPIAVAATSSSAVPFLALPAVLAVLTIGGGGGGGGTSITSAAPEPETWLMMILGFGFLGTTMRSRRRTEQKSTLTACT